MPRILIKAAVGLLVLVALVVAGMWVIGLGPFNTRPSPAAKLQPKVAASVAKTQAAQGQAVGNAEAAAKTTIAKSEKRTEIHVANIRTAAAVPRRVPADVPDGEFYRGVCESKLYARDPNCRRLGR